MEIRSGDKIKYIRLIEETYRMDSRRKRKYWKCECLACGKKFTAREDLIKSGQQISCGCIGKGKRAKYLYYKSLKNDCYVQQ